MKALRTYSRKPREHDATLLEGAEKLCRLCLEDPEDPTAIFTNTDVVGLSLATRITFCVGLEMTQDDCLPNQICVNCSKELDRCYQFRKQCEASYQRLKSHLLATIIERTKIENNEHDQTENKSESNNDENHSRNIKENYNIEETSNRNAVEIYDIEETCNRNVVEICYAEEKCHTNVGGNCLLVHPNQNSLVLEIDGTDLVQPADLGLDMLPQQSTSISVLQCQSIQSKPTLISPTYQLQSQPTHQLQSQPTRISPPPPLQSQQVRPSLILSQTTIPQICPPLQSQPSRLRIPQPSLLQSEAIQPQISLPKLGQPTSIAQSQLPIIQKQQIRLPVTTSKNQETVDWVLIDPPTPQSQAIRQPTLKLQPLNIPTQKSLQCAVPIQKSPTKTLLSEKLITSTTKSLQSLCNNQTKSLSNNQSDSPQSLCNSQSSCKHEPPPNMTISSLLENILTCVGALKRDRGFVGFNGVTEVDLMMGEGTVVNMELVEEEETGDSGNVTSEPVVKMARLDTVVQPKSKSGYYNKNSARKSCSVCQMTFSTSSTRARHERDVHSCARPHACSTCSAAFSQRSVLKRHVNTHMETRPFACEKCPKTFAQRGSLRVHAKSHEPKSVRDLHVKKCPYDNCEKTFQYPSGLSRHIQWHEGRQFVCHACCQGFSDKSALHRHLRSDKHKRNTATKHVGRYIIQSNNKSQKQSVNKRN